MGMWIYGVVRRALVSSEKFCKDEGGGGGNGFPGSAFIMRVDPHSYLRKFCKVDFCVSEMMILAVKESED